MNTTKDESYNGWKNYATWNVALWIGNDPGLYEIASTCKDYSMFIEYMENLGSFKTPDNIFWCDCTLDFDALNALIKEL